MIRQDPPGHPDSPLQLVVMGVAGSGKSTLAEGVAHRLGLPFAEADEFHPQANIEKMSSGRPLDDDDRWPWLCAIRDWMTRHAELGTGTVVTCSALKRSYRDLLREAEGRVAFVHVTGSAARIGDRLVRRSGHFMPASLLPSQFATLEQLAPGELGVELENDGTPDDLVERTIAWVRSLQPRPTAAVSDDAKEHTR